MSTTQGSRPSSRPSSGGSRGGSGRPSGPGGRGGRPKFSRRNSEGGRGFKKKVNRFYTIFSEQTKAIDYKDVERLSKFVTEKGKILPRRITGLTAKQQRMLTRAIKRARHAGVLAFQAD